MRPRLSTLCKCWEFNLCRDSWMRHIETHWDLSRPAETKRDPLRLITTRWDYPDLLGLIHAIETYQDPLRLIEIRWDLPRPIGTYPDPLGLIQTRWDLSRPVGTYPDPLGLIKAYWDFHGMLRLVKTSKTINSLVDSLSQELPKAPCPRLRDRYKIFAQ
jgi:hypothetical protein